jgi:hypothetical protein
VAVLSSSSVAFIHMFQEWQPPLYQRQESNLNKLIGLREAGRKSENFKSLTGNTVYGPDRSRIRIYGQLGY